MRHNRGTLEDTGTMLVRAMLLVFLLPLAAVAQGTATSDPRTGCRVVNAHPQPNESIAWSGGCVNGFAQGHGILQWFENSRPTERYEGDMRAGQMDGQGVLNTGNGGRYEGTFHDGVADGTGTWTTARGSFSGTWKKGCFNDGTRRAWVGTDPASCP